MLIEASSSSACTSTPPTFGSAGASHSSSSVAGVIGYAATNRTPPRIAPRPAASLPLMSQRDARRAGGGASANPAPTPPAARAPASIAARLAASVSPAFFRDLVTTCLTVSAGTPISSAVSPSATMFGQLPGIAFASCFNGRFTQRAPRARYASGGAPWSGSATIRLASSSGISSAKRWMFCQSIAISASKRSPRQSIGCGAKRSSAAASPPRICGPLDRTISPYQPARAAASSSMLPAVITPAPPEPQIASETVVRGVSRRSVMSSRPLLQAGDGCPRSVPCACGTECSPRRGSRV